MNQSHLTSSELLAILDVTRHMVDQRLVQPLMSFVATTVLQLVAAERCMIVLFADDDALSVRVALSCDGIEQDLADSQMSRSILDQVRQSMLPLRINDALAEDMLQASSSVRELGLRSVMCVPLVSRTRSIGAIYVENRSASGQFSEDHLVLLVLLSHQVVAALENARMYEALEEQFDTVSRMNAELTRALRLKDAFLAMISHELRTPLNAVLGYAEAMQEGVYGPLSNRQQYALDRISQSGHHLLGILSDMLDLVHITAGNAQLTLEPISVEQVCQAALQLVGQKAQEKHIRLVRSSDFGIDGVCADERRLCQILTNLLDNAIKFTPADGTVGLEVRGYPATEQITFCVWDTGIGIATEEMARLFQPFVQADERLARSYEGIGLGLALVQQLTDLHGGSVALESTIGAGSRFTITLPWRPDDNVAGIAPPAKEQSPLLQRKLRVLVADDHEPTLSLYRERLLALGCIVTTARTGVEALQQIRTQELDVVLLDIQMPELDGLSVLREVRADALVAPTPIIAITALAMPGDRERCLAAGATRYLVKPVCMRLLLRSLTDVLT